MKIFECFSGLSAQQWSYTDKNHLKMQDFEQCLDLTDGVTTNKNPVQVWKCTKDDINQVWTRGGAHFEERRAAPAPQIVQLHPNGNKAKCAGVEGNIFANQTLVKM